MSTQDVYVMPEDPLPWLTERFVANGCFDRVYIADWNPEKGTKLADSAKAAMLDTLTAIVSGLSDDSRSYSVRWTADPTASTVFRGKVVNIGGAAMVAKNLTDGQRAAVLTGLAYHEVAHIRHTRKLVDAIDAKYGRRPSALRMSNVAEDIRIERLITKEFPGYREALPVMMRWVGQGSINVADLSTRAGRWNAFVGATRYPFNWAFLPGDEAWRDEALAWAKKAGVAHTKALHFAAIEAGLLLVRPNDADPEPEAIVEPPIGPAGDDDDADPDISDDAEDGAEEPDPFDEDNLDRPQSMPEDEPEPEPAPEDGPPPTGPGPAGPVDTDDEATVEDEGEGEGSSGHEDGDTDERGEGVNEDNTTGSGDGGPEGNPESLDPYELPPLDHDCPTHEAGTATGNEKGWMTAVLAWKKAEAASDGRRIFRHGGTARVVRRVKITL